MGEEQQHSALTLPPTQAVKKSRRGLDVVESNDEINIPDVKTVLTEARRDEGVVSKVIELVHHLQ